MSLRSGRAIAPYIEKTNRQGVHEVRRRRLAKINTGTSACLRPASAWRGRRSGRKGRTHRPIFALQAAFRPGHGSNCTPRSEEHTAELQSLMRITYAVFCLKKQNKT